MPSSLFQNQGLNPQMIAQIKGIMQNMNSPQMQMLMGMTKGKGISPKQAVENICRQRGIDVNSFMEQIKNS